MMLSYERTQWALTPGVILVGVDEAGRGCLAGPVVAGAVHMSVERAEELYAGELAGVNDSKQLSPAQREHFFEILTQAPDLAWATGQASALEIDTVNILVATHIAMRRAVEALRVRAEHVLVDGLPVKGLPCASTAIIKGDANSFLIAAASVVAKVSRDHLMCALHEQYPHYGFAVHKGYGVSEHVAALHKYGSCPEHRHTFRPVQDVDCRLPGF
jgi:ribonuclease HII